MEEKKIFLLKLKSKGKAKKIEHIMRTQLGVNFLSIDFENRLMTINFDPKLITIEYISVLVRSVGPELIFSEHEVEYWQNQLGNYFVLKNRRKVLYLLSAIALIVIVAHLSVWFLLGLSLLTSIVYLSLFIYKSNKRFIRSLWKSDKLGILSSFIFTALGGASIYYQIINNYISILLFISILIVDIVTIFRWLNEKKSIEMNLL
nr:hypothetical protein [uncultured Bacteroides sp.]